MAVVIESEIEIPWSVLTEPQPVWKVEVDDCLEKRDGPELDEIFFREVAKCAASTQIGSFWLFANLEHVTTDNDGGIWSVSVGIAKAKHEKLNFAMVIAMIRHERKQPKPVIVKAIRVKP